MTDTDTFNTIYLDLEIRKSKGKVDDFGNYLFEVEASNENLDLQNQIVLQNALMESKEEFLRGGVISYNHLHKRKDEQGNVIADDSMIIGEPIDVQFDEATKKTIVKGKLYATNEKAKDIIKMLKAGSTRVRASVGGIFPKVIKNVKTGVEKVTHVLWNDLALTTMPVNNTVGYAVFAKSMTAAEFVEFLPIEIKKSLYAGYSTDSATTTGGQALIPEDTNTNIIDATETVQTLKANTPDADIQEAIAGLVEMLNRGRVNGKQDAADYLTAHGVPKEKTSEIIAEIIDQGGLMMKKSFTNSVASLLKSLVGGSGNGDEDDIKKNVDGGDDNDPAGNSDEDDIEKNKADPEENSEDEGDENDNHDDDDDVSGEEVLKAIDADLTAMRKSIQAYQEQIQDLGGAIEGLAQMIYAIGNQQLPPKSVLNKSFGGTSGGVPQTPAPKGRPTEDDLYRAQCVLQRCVQEGKIDMIKSSMISSDMQKCMRTGQPMQDEYYKFLQRELAKEEK
ncbi:hypothetical protein [Treponema sp.]|uniref:hypothetical protein n=1 Tax=Treponema sp. TaxID=166 RepID=UPI003FA2B893